MAENIIARNIRVLRAKMGWNQTELAERAGLSLRGIQAIENEGRDTRATNLVSIAKALKVSVSEIVGETDERTERARLLESILTRLPALNNDELGFISFVLDKLPVLETLDLAGTKGLLNDLLHGKNKKKT